MNLMIYEFHASLISLSLIRILKQSFDNDLSLYFEVIGLLLHPSINFIKNSQYLDRRPIVLHQAAESPEQCMSCLARSSPFW